MPPCKNQYRILAILASDLTKHLTSHPRPPEGPGRTRHDKWAKELAADFMKEISRFSHDARAFNYVCDLHAGTIAQIADIERDHWPDYRLKNRQSC